MLLSQITQECIQVDVDDVLKYQITTTVTTAGELPDVFLFVYDVIETTDPKQDAFVRVGNPYDLQTLLVGRAAAIAAGLTRYRTNAFVVRYTDLETAVQAKQAIKQRIDTAINTWYSFVVDFEATPPVMSDHPTTDEEYIITLTGVYTAAVTTREDAEAAVIVAAAAVTAAVASAAAASAQMLLYQNEVTFCQTARVTYWNSTPGVKSGITALEAAVQIYIAAGKAVYNAESGFTYPAVPPAGPWYNFWSALQDIDAAFTGPSGWSSSSAYVALLDTAFTNFCASATSGYIAAVNAKNTADLAVATAQTAKNQADANVVSAQAAEDVALAAIKAVCPTFDPSSI